MTDDDYESFVQSLTDSMTTPMSKRAGKALFPAGKKNYTPYGGGRVNRWRGYEDQ